MSSILESIAALSNPATPTLDKFRAASAERTALDWLEAADKLREKMREEWLTSPERFEQARDKDDEVVG